MKIYRWICVLLVDSLILVCLSGSFTREYSASSFRVAFGLIAVAFAILSAFALCASVLLVLAKRRGAFQSPSTATPTDAFQEEILLRKSLGEAKLRRLPLSKWQNLLLNYQMTVSSGAMLICLPLFVQTHHDTTGFRIYLFPGMVFFGALLCVVTTAVLFEIIVAQMKLHNNPDRESGGL